MFRTVVLTGVALILTGFLLAAAGLNLFGTANRCTLKIANPALPARYALKCRTIVMLGSPDAAKLLVGTLIPLIIGWVILSETARRKAQDRTVALHEEFSGMMEVRSRVYEELGFLTKRITPDHESFADVWRIVTFYERVFVLKEQGFLDPTLTLELFGETFIRWYEVHLRDKLSADESDVVARLHSMHRYYLANASSRQLTNWRRSASKAEDRFAAMRAAANPQPPPLTTPPPVSL